MIGSVSRLVPQGLQVGDVAQPTNAAPSSSGTAATSLELPPAAPISVGEPLQPLQPSQAVAADMQAPPSQADALNDLAAQAGRLEQSLNEAIDAAKAHNPILGNTKNQLIGLLKQTMEVHYELSQCKGTPEEDQVRLLQKCMDMHDHLQQTIAPRVIPRSDITVQIAYRAHELYFKMGTGVTISGTFDVLVGNEVPPRASSPRVAPQVDLLACARAAAMSARCEVVAPRWRPPVFRLENVYTEQQLDQLPLSARVDGTMLTKQEIDLWCADPPTNPWPIEPRLQKFYDAARDAAQDVRARENAARREQLASHLPRDLAGIVAGYAADAQ